MSQAEKSYQTQEEFISTHSMLYMSLVHLAGLFGYGEKSPVTELANSTTRDILRSLAGYVRERQPNDIYRLYAMYPEQLCKEWLNPNELKTRERFLQHYKRKHEEKVLAFAE